MTDNHTKKTDTSTMDSGPRRVDPTIPAWISLGQVYLITIATLIVFLVVFFLIRTAFESVHWLVAVLVGSAVGACVTLGTTLRLRPRN
jgi:membrane-associated phospholipid phosphatase